MAKRRISMPAAAVITAISTICAAQAPARAANPGGTAPAAVVSHTAGIDPALLTRATAGNPEAEFKVGAQYEVGARVEKDPAKAADWYRKAAEKGYPQAQHSLGVLYEFGNGVPTDYSAAADWYRKAAEKGFAPAEFSLGLCYVHGKGVPQDFDKALGWYQKAAEQKNSDAMLNLAFLYHNGQGVPKDEKRSFDYVRQAAEAGSADAQFQLGMDYFNGENGLQSDNDLARKWLRRSAEQGHVAAQFNYAMLLKAEPSEVYFWLGLATPHLTGSTKDTSQQLRAKAAARLVPNEKTEIERRIAAWHPAEEQP